MELGDVVEVGVAESLCCDLDARMAAVAAEPAAAEIPAMIASVVLDIMTREEKKERKEVSPSISSSTVQQSAERVRRRAHVSADGDKMNAQGRYRALQKRLEPFE